MIKAITFDAMGTLFHLRESVGHHYAAVAGRFGINAEPAQLDEAFRRAWKTAPPRAASGVPRPDDDRDWWRALVNRVMDAALDGQSLDRAAYFEAVYAHFAAPGVWFLYPEVRGVLERIRTRHHVAVVSNFDGRLRRILRDLEVVDFFPRLFISSEVGADKPDPLIYEQVARELNLDPGEILHVGDDPVCDWEGAARAGLKAFHLHRPANSLNDVAAQVL